MKKLRSAALGVLFCVLLVSSIAGVSRLVERKASRIKFEPFLDCPEDHDVLFIGDSLMVNGIFPMELWQDYGIASYNISSYGNTLPVSYWVMENALQYVTPKLMVIGVKDVEKSYKLSGSSSDVHTALDCYPLTLTKIRAIEDLMDDPNATDDSGTPYTTLKWEYYFKLGKYHSRWSELSTSDFHPIPTRKRGAEYALGVAPFKDYTLIDEYQQLENTYGVGFVYLRKMIESCQSRGIDVLLVHMPYPAETVEQEAANAVWNIADEYGVDYIDFVSMDQVVDYATDCYDAHSHLNPSGARKVTDYLGRYIREHFAVPDRRSDPHYAPWLAYGEAYMEEKAGYIQRENNLENLLMLLHDSDYSLCLSIGADAKLSEQDMLLIQNIAREHIFEEDMFAKWSNNLFPLEHLGEGAPYLLVVDRTSGTHAEASGVSSDISASFGAVHFDDNALVLEQGSQVTSIPYTSSGIQAIILDAATNEVIAERAI